MVESERRTRFIFILHFRISFAGIFFELFLRIHHILDALKRRLNFFSLVESFGILEVKFVLALGAEMIEVLDNPLPDALFMKDVLAREENCLLHVFITNCAGEVMKLIQLVPLHFLQETHSLRQLFDAKEGVKCLFYVGDYLKPSDNGQENES